MLIAHDLGTSGNKASLHDADGRLLASATVEYPTHYDRGAVSEQNPEHWWRAVVEATHALLADAGVSPSRIEGLCVSGQMMGLVLLDANGVVLRPAMIWSDQRATRQAADLARTVGEETAYRITGHRIAPTYTLPKLLWVREHEPQVYERTAHVCVAKDYVNFRLTGRVVTDHSDASSTDAYDLIAGRWSAELLGAAGVDTALWPEIVESTAVIGTLTASAAEELGLSASTRVVAGGGDGLMASVGAGCISPDSPGYVCLGTSAWYAATAVAPVLDPEQRSFSFRHVVPGLFTPCAATQTGAGSLQWLSELFAPASVAELVDEGISARAAVEGLFFLPYLMGERSPWWDPDASGVFAGLRRHHGRPNLARAVLEAVAFNLALCMQPLRHDSSPIDVIGGGAVSEPWLQLMADVWQVPVRRRSITSEANSLGAAVTGLVGLGHADFSIARKLSSVLAEFEPTSSLQSEHSRFADAYRALRPWFAGGRTDA